MNGGRCTEQLQDFTCKCASQYYGKTCTSKFKKYTSLSWIQNPPEMDTSIAWFPVFILSVFRIGECQSGQNLISYDSTHFMLLAVLKKNIHLYLQSNVPVPTGNVLMLRTMTSQILVFSSTGRLSTTPVSAWTRAGLAWPVSAPRATRESPAASVGQTVSYPPSHI